MSPRRHYAKWKNGRALDQYVGRLVDQRVVNGPTAVSEKDNAKHYAIDDAIAANKRGKLVKGAKTSMDNETRDMLIASVKTLIFAGHDTSASTLCVSFTSLYHLNPLLLILIH